MRREGSRMDQGGVWASEAFEGAKEKEDRGKWGEELETEK